MYVMHLRTNDQRHFEWVGNYHDLWQIYWMIKCALLAKANIGIKECAITVIDSNGSFYDLVRGDVTHPAQPGAVWLPDDKYVVFS